jgi:hypothetical protein
LKASIVLAFERLNENWNEALFNRIIQDISIEYEDFKIDFICESLRKGSLGRFGRTYRFSSQEVCFWIKKNYQEWKEAQYISPEDRLVMNVNAEIERVKNLKK